MLFLVDGLYRSKWASFHSPSMNSRNSGAARFGAVSLSGSGTACRARHSLRASAIPIVETGPRETRLDAPPTSRNMTKVRAPVGRTRTPRPGTRLSQTVYSRSRGRRRAMAASVRRMRFLPAMAQRSRMAPTVSAASTTMASSRWVYLSVVSALRCPSSRPMARTVSPCRKAMLAWV